MANYYLFKLIAAIIIFLSELNLINARPHRRHHERCVERSTEHIIDRPCHAPYRRFLSLPPTATPSDNVTINLMFDMLKNDVQDLLNTFACAIAFGCSQSLVEQIGSQSENTHETVPVMHGRKFTTDVLQIINEYYANVTFIVKQASKLKRDLILRQDSQIDIKGYMLLNDMKTVMCELHHNISDISGDVNNIRGLRTADIHSPCIGMSGDNFKMSAIQILHNLRNLVERILQSIGS